jgi:hypothetical protein
MLTELDILKKHNSDKNLPHDSDSVLSQYNGVLSSHISKYPFSFTWMFYIIIEKTVLSAVSTADFYAGSTGPPKKNFNPFNVTIPHMSFISNEVPIIFIKYMKRTSCIIHFAWLKHCYIMNTVLWKISYAGAAL